MSRLKMDRRRTPNSDKLFSIKNLPARQTEHRPHPQDKLGKQCKIIEANHSNVELESKEVRTDDRLVLGERSTVTGYGASTGPMVET